ncbi:MAG: hypothetical protein AAGC81_06905 [Pseudomonadota bacterium]
MTDSISSVSREISGRIQADMYADHMQHQTEAVDTAKMSMSRGKTVFKVRTGARTEQYRDRSVIAKIKRMCTKVITAFRTDPAVKKKAVDQHAAYNLSRRSDHLAEHVLNHKPDSKNFEKDKNELLLKLEDAAFDMVNHPSLGWKTKAERADFAIAYIEASLERADQALVKNDKLDWDPYQQHKQHLAEIARNDIPLLKRHLLDRMGVSQPKSEAAAPITPATEAEPESQATGTVIKGVISDVIGTPPMTRKGAQLYAKHFVDEINKNVKEDPKLMHSAKFIEDQIYETMSWKDGALGDQVIDALHAHSEWGLDVNKRAVEKFQYLCPALNDNEAHRAELERTLPKNKLPPIVSPVRLPKSPCTLMLEKSARAAEAKTGSRSELGQLIAGKSKDEAADAVADKIARDVDAALIANGEKPVFEDFGFMRKDLSEAIKKQMHGDTTADWMRSLTSSWSQGRVHHTVMGMIRDFQEDM